MKGLAAFQRSLAGHRRVAVDAGVFAAYLSAEPRRGPLGLALFEEVERGRLHAITSVLTMMSLLEGPHRRRDLEAATELAFLVPTFPNLELVPLTLPIAERAAHYRAAHTLSDAAAILAATARGAGAELLLATDPALRALAGELEVLVLDDFVA
ncbi:MAG: PIN domain-containing protein [Candidatus Sericytochromatia bacterium]|nr:PIN domain-containing protein [Candidatus Sericytochromatia bacterium]